MDPRVLIVGEQQHSALPDDTLKTFALGSCIGVILLDPKTRTVGMAHIALPDSKVNPERAKEKPGYFVDTGIDYLIELMVEAGCSAGGAGFVAKLTGGAAVLKGNDTFNVGGRNVEAARRFLARKGIRIVSEDVGKTFSRTAAVNVGTAKVMLSSPGRDDWFI